ncbi:MAG: permease [Deltaproteobacteria bacterium]|nr:permease [Deltaproteobacteria bacterium]
MHFQAFAGRTIETANEFLALTWKVLPFFLIGAIAGAALQAALLRKWSERILGGRGIRPLLAAICAAALLPGCSCATMPMAAGIKDSGAPRIGTVAAFIFISPLLSPVTVALTWTMLGWRMTAARIAASFAGSIGLGLIINRFEGWFAAGPSTSADTVPPGSADPVCETASCGDAADACAQASAVSISKGFVGSLVVILRSITPYFLLGMLIAAALSALLPEDAIPGFLGGSSGFWAYILAALVGIPLYVCEGEEVPITYALVARGLGPGPALTFLLGSVGTCVPTMLMSRNIIGRRATTFYIAFWFVFAIGAGILLQAFLA